MAAHANTQAWPEVWKRVISLFAHSCEEKSDIYPWKWEKVQRRCYLQKEKRSTAENLLVTATFLKLAFQPQENYFSYLLSENNAFAPWVCRKKAFGKVHVLERMCWEWTARKTAAAPGRALVA